MRSPHAGRLGVRRTLSAGREGRRGERTSGAAVARPPGRPAPQVWSAARQIVPAPTLAPLKPELQDKKQAPGGRQVRNSAGTPVSWLAYTGQGPSSPWGYRTRPRRRSRPGRCRRAGDYVFGKIGDNVTHPPRCRPSGTRWMACKSRPAPQASALHTLRSRRRQRWRWRSRSAVIMSRHTAPLPRQWRAATLVIHHQQQAWGGWPAARLTAPRVASTAGLTEVNVKCKCNQQKF